MVAPPISASVSDATTIDSPVDGDQSFLLCQKCGDIVDEPNHSRSASQSSKDAAGDDSDVIPRTHDCRTLVLCFDGTGDQFDSDNSNVVQFVSMLKKHDPHEQLIYYQTGIGTYTGPGTTNPITRTFWRALDEAIAWSLNDHVTNGYEFLMQNYHAGDKICIFGFSRGAYTARALAGMIHKVGLLTRDNRQQIPFAYKMFKMDTDEGWTQGTEFKKAFSIDVNIEFLGVWDTVSSVGLVARHLPFTASNTAVRYFRHALSLDERRAKFKANHWHRSSGQKGTKAGDMPWRDQRRGKEGEEEETDVLEVWFAGCHADVGGGAVKNGTPNSLSRIPLRWMVRQCFLAGTGIQFHGRLLRTIGLDPERLLRLGALEAEKREGRAGKAEELMREEEERLKKEEEEEDAKDALCPIYDELVLRKPWWVLEVLPLPGREWKEEAEEWVRKISINLGAPRRIPHHPRPDTSEGNEAEPVIRVHRTVKMRMEAEAVMGAGEEEAAAERGDRALGGKKYAPRAKWEVEPVWVD